MIDDFASERLNDFNFTNGTFLRSSTLYGLNGSLSLMAERKLASGHVFTRFAFSANAYHPYDFDTHELLSDNISPYILEMQVGYRLPGKRRSSATE